MKRFWICLLLILTLCTSIACRGDIPQDPDNLPAQTPQEPDDSQEQTPFSPYSWSSYSIMSGLSSGVCVRIEDTNLPPLNYQQLHEISVDNHYKMSRIIEADDCCIVELDSKYDINGGLIPLDAETFGLRMGIGVTPLHTHYDYDAIYNTKITRIAMTFTIDGETYTMVENADFKKLFVASLSTPLFDSKEGNVSHIYRYSYPTIGDASVPLSLFDFSERDSIEVTVSAVFFAGEEVVDIPFSSCTFQLVKTELGYQFVGTDPAFEGYRAESPGV